MNTYSVPWRLVSAKPAQVMSHALIPYALPYSYSYPFLTLTQTQTQIQTQTLILTLTLIPTSTLSTHTGAESTDQTARYLYTRIEHWESSVAATRSALEAIQKHLGTLFPE